MAQVKTSAPITLSNVKSVFGSTTLYNLRRGGGYVPAIANAYGSISTSAPTLLSFASAYYPPVQIAAVGLNAFDISPGGASCLISVSTSGYFQQYDNGSLQSNTVWKLAGHQADYDVYLQKVSGDTPAGEAVNTWLNLVGTRQWSIATASSGYDTKDFSGYIRLRMSASPYTEFANSAVNMTATIEV